MSIRRLKIINMNEPNRNSSGKDKVTETKKFTRGA